MKENNYTHNRWEKYNSLTDELREMIAGRGRGYHVAQEMNDQFWEDLGTHRQRMLEQIDRLNSNNPETLDEEIRNADSIYEATRSYIAKHQ